MPDVTLPPFADWERRSMRFNSLANARPVFALLLAAAVFLGVQTDSRADDSAMKPRTVLITGANRGLGLEFARQYKDAGWHVIGTARDPQDARELDELGVRVMQLDVASQDSVEALAVALGDEPIDLLINNAGIFPRVGKLDEIDFDDYNRTLVVNTIGPVRVTRALLPNLRGGELKMIAGLSSNLGSIAENERGNFYGYRESKAALNMFTKTLAAELGPEGFTCIVLTPGWVQTDMGGPNAALTPAESIAGMKAVLDRLTPADNGTFWSYNGSQVPW
jgi:NAD(P)-dependent dehydrogenase (short-subunit alcohol dehydrogenase family)